MFSSSPEVLQLLNDGGGNDGNVSIQAPSVDPAVILDSLDHRLDLGTLFEDPESPAKLQLRSSCVAKFPRQPLPGARRLVASSPEFLAYSLADGKIRVMLTQSGGKHVLQCAGDVLDLATVRGQWLCSLDTSGAAMLWDVTTGRLQSRVSGLGYHEDEDSSDCVDGRNQQHQSPLAATPRARMVWSPAGESVAFARSRSLLFLRWEQLLPAPEDDQPKQLSAAQDAVVHRSPAGAPVTTVAWLTEAALAYATAGPQSTVFFVRAPPPQAASAEAAAAEVTVVGLFPAGPLPLQNLLCLRSRRGTSLMTLAGEPSADLQSRLYVLAAQARPGLSFRLTLAATGPQQQQALQDDDVQLSDLQADPTGQFVVVAFKSRSIQDCHGFVFLRFRPASPSSAESSSNDRFDCVRVFFTANPSLGFSLHPVSPTELQLAVVHPRFVQLYALELPGLFPDPALVTNGLGWSEGAALQQASALEYQAYARMVQEQRKQKMKAQEQDEQQVQQQSAAADAAEDVQGASHQEHEEEEEENAVEEEEENQEDEDSGDQSDEREQQDDREQDSSAPDHHDDEQQQPHQQAEQEQQDQEAHDQNDNAGAEDAAADDHDHAGGDDGDEGAPDASHPRMDTPAASDSSPASAEQLQQQSAHGGARHDESDAGGQSEDRGDHDEDPSDQDDENQDLDGGHEDSRGAAVVGKSRIQEAPRGGINSNVNSHGANGVVFDSDRLLGQIQTLMERQATRFHAQVLEERAAFGRAENTRFMVLLQKLNDTVTELVPRAVSNTLRDQVHSVLVPHLSQAFTPALKEVVVTLVLRTLSQTVGQEIRAAFPPAEQLLDQAEVAERLSEPLRAAVAEAMARVERRMTQQVGASLRESMAEITQQVAQQQQAAAAVGAGSGGDKAELERSQAAAEKERAAAAVSSAALNQLQEQLAQLREALQALQRAQSLSAKQSATWNGQVQAALRTQQGSLDSVQTQLEQVEVRLAGLDSSTQAIASAALHLQQADRHRRDAVEEAEEVRYTPEQAWDAACGLLDSVRSGDSTEKSQAIADALLVVLEQAQPRLLARPLARLGEPGAVLYPQLLDEEEEEHSINRTADRLDAGDEMKDQTLAGGNGGAGGAHHGEGGLPQHILLSLIQQLSHDLGDPELFPVQLEWLRECLTSLLEEQDRLSPGLRRAMPRIVAQAWGLINGMCGARSPAPKKHAPALRMIRSVLQPLLRRWPLQPDEVVGDQDEDVEDLGF